MKKFSAGFLGIAAATVMAAVMSLAGSNEAKAVCVASAEIPPGANCLGNGGPIPSFLNFEIGFLNDSGNANVVFGTGDEFHLSFFNAHIGLLNGSGNGNIIATNNTDANAVNIATLNFEAGVLNGAGNANILLADSGDDTALNVQIANTYFGVFNGSLNGNNIGTNDATVIQIENFAQGVGNLSGNGNAVGNCDVISPNDPSFNTTPEGLSDSDPNLPGGARLRCTRTGNSRAIIVNNTAFGNLNGSGNGNALGGLSSDTATAGSATLIMTNNRLFGNLNASGNGNAFGDGENGLAVIENNFISGNASGTGNGNGASGRAIIVNNRVMGDGSLSDNGNVEDGEGNAVLVNNTVIGNNSMSHNEAGEYRNNIVMGDDSADFNQDGFSNNAIIGHRSGNNAAAGAENNVVLGNDAGNNLGGDNNVVIGNGAGNSMGTDDTAIGARAQVTADHSTALGADAVANLPNQMVFGTSADTYKAPGITSGLSRSRQSGPLEVVTSDANGNLATDGGSIFERLDENRSGVALALAVVNPDLTRDERFGISANYANFDGASAFGMGIEGVVGHDWIAKGDRVAITGGWGVGFEDGRGDDVFGGRVGAQWTWGHAPVADVAPLKLN